MRYKDKQAQENTLKLRTMLKELPAFMEEYFRSLSDQTAPLTRLGYALDYKIFFGYLSDEVLDGMPITSISISDLAQLTATDIEAFMEYLTYYIPQSDNNAQITTKPKANHVS